MTHSTVIAKNLFPGMVMDINGQHYTVETITTHSLTIEVTTNGRPFSFHLDTEIPLV